MRFKLNFAVLNSAKAVLNNENMIVYGISTTEVAFHNSFWHVSEHIINTVIIISIMNFHIYYKFL